MNNVNANFALHTPPDDWPATIQLIYGLWKNPLNVWPRKAYEQPLVSKRRPFGELYVISEPLAVRRILLDNAANYLKSHSIQRVLGPAIGSGLVTAEGDEWRDQRRVLNRYFKKRQLEANIPQLVRTIDRALCELQQTDEALVDIHQVAMSFATKVILECVVGINDCGESSIIARKLSRYESLFGRAGILELLEISPSLTPWTQFRKRVYLRSFRRTLDSILLRISTNENGAGHSCPLQPLAKQFFIERNTPTDPLQKFLVDELATLLFAGAETTAAAITWTIYLISLFPELQDSLIAESSAIFSESSPSIAALNALSFTSAVIHEAMRLYPPAPMVMRRAKETDELCNTRISPGSTVMILPWIIHRHRMLWKDPDKFVPERFLGSAADSIERMAYIPFGFGQRGCIGGGFAMIELLLTVLMSVRRFSIQYAGRTPAIPVQRIGLVPQDGVLVRLVRRKTLQ